MHLIDVATNRPSVDIHVIFDMLLTAFQNMPVMGWMFLIN